MRFLFEPLLLANYCLGKYIVSIGDKNRLISGTLHIFATPFAFTAAGLYLVFIASIPYKFTSFTPIFIGVALVMGPLQLYMEKEAKKDFYRWEIAKQYKALTKAQRKNKSTLAGFVFLGGILFSIFLGATYFSGYLVNQ